MDKINYVYSVLTDLYDYLQEEKDCICDDEYLETARNPV